MREIRRERPPIYEMICEAIGTPSPRTVYAYDRVIWHPAGGPLPQEIIDHEEVHFDQQERHGLHGWWAEYLASPEFRYTQEFVAHVAELRSYAARVSDRNYRARYAHQLAARLAGPLYGNLMPYSTVLADLRQHA